jgi:putative ABC transport system permease protein
MTIRDSIEAAWQNIKGNKLRAAITVVIIALGIFALILIITAIAAASNSLTSSFSTMGANSFNIRFREMRVFMGGPPRGNSEKVSKSAQRTRNSTMGIPISLQDARLFKERYEFQEAIVSIARSGPMSIEVKNELRKTNPDVNVYGSDENYLDINGYALMYGRNLTKDEVESGAAVCLIGQGVAEKLFPDNFEKALETKVSVDNLPYRVIGVLEDKGSSAFFNTSKIIVTSYNSIRRNFPSESASYTIAVSVSDIKLIDMAISEAKATFRPIRKLTVKDNDNFYINKSDSIASTLLENLRFLEIGTIGIAFITLIGAAIGLMNIMLVAVNERTREIGLAKALGNTASAIRSQFLFESVIISLLGAVAGIISGVLIGNIVSILMNTGFVVPWGWVIAGIVVCTVVGLLAGLYPAMKAAKLDPIVALRHE